MPFFAGCANSSFPLCVARAPGMIAFSSFRPISTQGEGVVIVFAVVDETQVDLVLTRKEKLMRWREDGQRAGSCSQNQQAVSGPQPNRICIWRPCEVRFLPVLCGVAPRKRGAVVDGKSLEAGLIDVCDRRLLSFGNGFLPQQV